MQSNLNRQLQPTLYEGITLEVGAPTVNSSSVNAEWIEAKANLKQHIAHGSKLFFAPLAPLEKGFFIGVEGSHINRQAMQELYQLLNEGDEKKLKDWIHAYVRSFPGKVSKAELSKILPTHLPSSAFTYLQSGRYCYFEELKRQYKGYRAGQKSIGYSLMQTSDEINVRAEVETNIPMGLFTIEGIHSLGVGNPEDEFLQEGESPKDITIGRLKSRIRQLKGEEALEDNELKRWEHTPFLFRLANHFGNGFFGQARSFADIAQLLLDQRRDLDKGALKAASYEIVRELLGLDEYLKPTGSKRILIDMLHLSASARNDIYQNIFRPFNKNVDPGHPIPVVFTSAAYSGVDYLAEMVRQGREGTERVERADGFHGGSINLSDEDVLAVFWSKGMIALSMNEERLGADHKFWKTLFHNSPRARAMRLLKRQLTGIISVPFAYHLTNPLQMWDYLSIGNGLSGSDSVMEYYRHAPLSTLEEDLEEVLSKMKKEEPMWFGGYKPSVLVRKICSENITEFVSKNFFS